MILCFDKDNVFLVKLFVIIIGNIFGVKLIVMVIVKKNVLF